VSARPLRLAPLLALLPLLLAAPVRGAAADLAAAAEHLKLARYEAARAAAAARLEAHPDDGDAWHLLGEALAARGRDLAAGEAFRSALAHGARRPLTVRVALAGLHQRAGDRERAERERRAVLERWRDGLVEEPRELLAAAASARGLARGDPSLRRAALRICEEAIRRAPEDPEPRLALAELLLESYNNAEARPLFEAAVSLDAEHPRALLGLARSLHFDHQHDAIDTVRAALSLAPDLVPARVFLARLLIDDDRPDAARTELEAALAVNPRALPALSLLAGLHDRDGDQDGMLALVEFIHTLSPRDAGVYETLAELAADRRRYADAVRYASRAVALDAQSWDAHRLLGINRMRLGDLAAARRALETAFRGDPFNVWTKNTLDLLDAMDGYAVIARGRFVLTAREDQARVLAPYLFPIAEAAWDAHAGRYGAEPSRPVRIEVHPRHEDLSVRTLGVVGVDLLGVSFGPTVVLDAPMANPSGPANWASVLWHELAHTFQLAVSRGRAPRWIAEGMAVHDEHLAREGWGQDVGPGFLQAWLEGRLAPASRLEERFLNPRDGEDLGHAYLQAGLLAAWIHRDHGPQALRGMLDGYARGWRTPEVIERVLGMAPERFDAGFAGYVQQRFGPALEALAPSPGDATSRYASLLRAAREVLRADETPAPQAIEEARTALEQARALVPGHAGPGGPHRGLAAIAERAGDAAAREAALRALIAVDADDLDAHLELADLLAARGAGSSAARVLERALLIQPFDAALHRRLAELLEGERNWAAARREWAAVVTLGAVDPVEARYRLARAASRAGDLEAARDEVLWALESAPLFEPGLELLLEVRERLAARSEEGRR